jgi:hypothetical protein
MASQQKKKAASNVGRNGDRRNGKAWKKNPKPAKRVRTEERNRKDQEIRMQRRHRYEEAKAQREAEKLAEVLAALANAEIEARLPEGMLKLKKKRRQPQAA